MRVQKNEIFFGLGLTRAGISFPDIELMEELAQVFQVDVADIIRGEEAGRALQSGRKKDRYESTGGCCVFCLCYLEF